MKTDQTQPPNTARLPLTGIRVLDLTSVIMGPYATMILGEMGADVIKVEAPEGDTTRGSGPYRNKGMAAMFLAVNRNKRSVVLDLKTEAGRASLADLVATADVFVHNMRDGAAAKLALDFASISARKPDIVYVAARGFKSGGPYEGLPAYDDIIQGACGIGAEMGHLFGEPAYPPFIMADKTCGLFVANAIMMALFRRERTGVGANVEVPMFEAMSSYTLVDSLFAGNFHPDGGTPKGADSCAPGYPRGRSKDRRPYKTKNGYMASMPYQDKHFAALFRISGRDDLAADPRFQTQQSRLTHIDAMYTMLAEVFASRTTEEWLAPLNAAGVPAMKMNSLEDLFTEPQLQASDLVQATQHPSEGMLRSVGVPIYFADVPAPPRTPAPRLGQHTDEVLKK